MAIRKQDLREFISNKAKVRKDALRDLVRAEIESTFTPIVNEVYKAADSLERRAQQFHDALLDFIEENKRFDYWAMRSIVRDINSHVIGMRADLIRKETNLAASNLLDGGTNGLIKEVNPLMGAVKSKMSAKISEYRDLVKLTSEILTILDSSHNGDKAYKRLEELGVDLSGFAVSSQNLPAVIKLSVDPCLINGNCGSVDGTA